MTKDGRVVYLEVVFQCSRCSHIERANSGHYDVCGVVLYPGKAWSNEKTCRYYDPRSLVKPD